MLEILHFFILSFFHLLNQMFNNVLCHFPLCLRVISCKPIMTVDDGHFVCVNAEACTFVLKTVQDDEIEVLTLQFVLSILLFVVRFESKANEHLLLFLDSTKSRSNVLCRLQLKFQVISLTLYLLIGSRLWREVSNSSTKDCNICFGEML